MVVNRSLLFLVAAIVCFAIGLLIGIDVLNGDTEAWLFGGLLSFALAHLP